MLQNEWSLVHLILYNEIISSLTHHRLLSIKAPLLYFGKLHAALFQSVDLWSEYTGKLSNVCGVDMSAINQLMVDVNTDNEHSGFTEVKSVRFSQWNAKLGKEFYINSIKQFDLLDLNGAQSDWIRSVDLSSVLIQENIEDTIYSGIVFWLDIYASPGSNGNTIHLCDSHPCRNPDSVQAFRCFERPILAKELIRHCLKLDVMIRASDNVFLSRIVDMGYIST
jgi:hypothetical protein